MLWCLDELERKNICDGTKADCISKANALCQKELGCHGFMWNNDWGQAYKGVKICTSLELTTKPEKDWELYRKECKNSGITSQIKCRLEKLEFYTL